MSAADARAEFERKHPKPQKVFIGSTTTTWSIKDFWLQYGRPGPILSIVCYTPPGLDPVRWKLGRYWTEKGTVFDDFTTNYISTAGTATTSQPYSARPLWVIGGGTEQMHEPFWLQPGVRGNFNSFPRTFERGKEYNWDQITLTLGDEKKEILVVGQGSTDWGINGGDRWIYTVDPNQTVGAYRAADFSHLQQPFGYVFGTEMADQIFFDHAFEEEMPFSKEQIGEREFGSVRQLYADIKPVYNFYIESYETKSSKATSVETMLPNMYAFLLVQQEQDPEDVIVSDDLSSIDDVFELHLTLNKAMSDTMFAVDRKGLPLSREVLNQKGAMTFQKSSKGQYFDKWAQSYDTFMNSWNDNGPSKQLSDKFSNLIVPMSDLRLYRDFNNKRSQFPMYVDINFSTDVTKTFFADALKDSYLSSIFIKDMISSRNAYRPKAGQGPYSEAPIIPRFFDYGRGNFDHGPAVLVWWGGKNANQTTAQWESGGGMWTTVTNIEHPPGGLRNLRKDFRIGDWVEVKSGVWSETARVYEENKSAQIIAYSTNSRSLPEPNQSNTGFLTKWWRNAGIPNQTDITPSPNAAVIAQLWAQFSTSPTGEGNIVYPAQDAYNLWPPPAAGDGQDPIIPISRGTTVSQEFRMTNLAKEETIRTRFPEWEITSWFDDFIKDPVEAFTTPSSDAVFLGQYNEDLDEAGQETTFYKTLMSIIFAGKFEKLVSKYTRSYQQILLGKKAHSETVFYKIEKWGVGPDPDRNLIGLGGSSNIPLQTIYFPNSSDVDVHRYIDTQVKYNKRYAYRVYAMVVVFGTQYRYSLDGITGTNPASTSTNLTGGPPKAEICVFTKPSVRLVQIPYYQFVGRVMDAPPIWPDVDVIQYKNQNNKVLFFLRGNVGNYKLNPIPIELSDYPDIFALAEAQRLKGTDPMEFRSDDQARVFEIFRISKKPLDYSDFEGHKLVEVKTDVFVNPKKAATAAAYMDVIVPNKKYYYIFRTVDVHGHISNPTPIYEIEIIDHDGGAVLITKVFQLKEEKQPRQTPSKTAQKYIYITPNPDQLEINRKNSELIDPQTGINLPGVPQSVINNGAQLGISDEVVWDKKYKIRVSSKKTGRKIDFNIQCKTKAWVRTVGDDPSG